MRPKATAHPNRPRRQLADALLPPGCAGPVPVDLAANGLACTMPESYVHAWPWLACPTWSTLHCSRAPPPLGGRTSAGRPACALSSAPPAGCRGNDSGSSAACVDGGDRRPTCVDDRERQGARGGPWVLAVANGLRFQDVTRPGHLMAASFRFMRRLQGPPLASASLPRRPVLSARSCLPA